MFKLNSVTLRWIKSQLNSAGIKGLGYFISPQPTFSLLRRLFFKILALNSHFSGWVLRSVFVSYGSGIIHQYFPIIQFYCTMYFNNTSNDRFSECFSMLFHPQRVRWSLGHFFNFKNRCVRQWFPGWFRYTAVFII